ncbi:hypothetical protein GCM10023096_07630 [Nonomuraea ferruginea]
MLGSNGLCSLSLIRVSLAPAHDGRPPPVGAGAAVLMTVLMRREVSAGTGSAG